MPTTALGIYYPASGDNTRIWEHMQSTADSVQLSLEPLYTTPAVRAYNNAGVSLLNNVLTLVPLQAESASMKTVAGMHSTSVNTSRLIASVDGVYQCQWMGGFPANAAGRRVAQVRKNAAGSNVGGTQLWSPSGAPAPSSQTQMGGADDVLLTAGEYVELFMLQNSGSGLTNDPGEFVTFMTLRLVRYV